MLSLEALEAAALSHTQLACSTYRCKFAVDVFDQKGAELG
jgi:hypothetical protein